MKKLEVVNKVDNALQKAIQTHTIETPPVNFTDRTMLKLQEVEILSVPKTAHALGLKFKIVVGGGISSFVSLVLLSLLPKSETTLSIPFADASEIFMQYSFQSVEIITLETFISLLAAFFGVILVFLADFFFSKKLVHARS